MHQQGDRATGLHAISIVNVSETIRKFETEQYTNDLGYIMLSYRRTILRSGRRSMLEYKTSCIQVDGCVDPNIVASRFSEHLARAYSCNNSTQADQLKSEFQQLRKDYCSIPISDADIRYAELVSLVITGLKRGNAAGIDGLSAEHLLFCHPVLSVVLAKLFQLMVMCSYVPDGFRYSIIVPLPKPKEYFRRIAISPILTNVFEYCLLDRYKDYVVSAGNQFGFKKVLGAVFQSAQYVILSTVMLEAAILLTLRH